MKNYISWRSFGNHFIRVQTFPLHMHSSCHCFSHGQKLSILAAIPPVETLPNMTQGAHANDRDRGFSHETRSAQNYSIYCSQRVAFWNVWLPHIWRLVLCHIIIQLLKV